MDTSASARDRSSRTVEPVLGAEGTGFLLGRRPERDVSELATRDHLDRELRGLSSALRQEMVTKKDLRDLERRLTEHIDLRVDARLAANMRATLAWLAAMNATMLAAVIAALRL